MVARHCSQIPRQENRLGRHYSRFRPIRRIAYQQYQPVAQSRRVKNRKRRRRIGEVRLVSDHEHVFLLAGVGCIGAEGSSLQRRFNRLGDCEG
jgi:hypothetical protein